MNDREILTASLRWHTAHEDRMQATTISNRFKSESKKRTGFGGADAYKDWPDTVQALIYPAGTYVRGRGEVLSLDTIYDSTNLKINDYIQLFVEEKMLVARRAYSARLVTFPTLVNGVTSQPRELDGNGVVVPATP